MKRGGGGVEIAGDLQNRNILKRILDFLLAQLKRFFYLFHIFIKILIYCQIFIILNEHLFRGSLNGMKRCKNSCGNENCKSYSLSEFYLR